MFYVSETGMISGTSKERHIIVYFDVSYLCQDDYSEQQFDAFMQSLKGIGIKNTNSCIAMKQAIGSYLKLDELTMKLEADFDLGSGVDLEMVMMQIQHKEIAIIE